jgi:hypothetical protein
MSSAVPPETAAATGASRHQGGTRARPAAARIEDAIIATAVLALLAAACVTGGGSAATVADTPGQQALKYSQCIRSHGVPGSPDPDSQGPTRHHTQRSPKPGLTAAPDGAAALPAPGAKRHHHHHQRLTQRTCARY